MDLLSETLRLLRETSVPYSKIAKEAKVSLRWLYRFADEDFEDYGILRVQRVYEVLNNAKVTQDNKAA